MIYIYYYKFIYIKIAYLIFLLFTFHIRTKYQKKSGPKISIFLPIYNKEKYINKCIQNLQNQTLKDIEIVAVNDYSTDNTLKILIDLAKNDDRIKIINNDKNKGLLYSRAMGIIHSNGEYLMNLDPDDELRSIENLEYIYNIAVKSNVDILSFSIYNKKRKTIIKCDNNNEILKPPKLFQTIFKDNNEIGDYLIWNKLIRKELFLQAYEDFKEEIYKGKWNYFEDDVWSILVNRNAKSKLCIDSLIYIYNNNSDSLMNKRFEYIEFQNLLFRHEKYKKIFTLKKDEKYLIAEYDFLLNRLKWQIKYLLLLNDKSIKEQIINTFLYFLRNYYSTKERRNDIYDFLKLII